MAWGSSLARWTAVAVVLAVVAASVAVMVTGGSTGDERPPLPENVENVSERYASVDGLEGEVHRVLRRGNETIRTTMRYELRPGTGQVAYRKVGGNESGPDVIVSNGSVLWMYDRQTGNYSRRQIEGNLSNRRGQYMERLFASLNQTSTTPDRRRTPTPGVAPVPAVPSGVGPAGDNGTGVTYRGIDVVDGREAYVLELSSQHVNSTGSLTRFNQTLWIDTEWYVLLKIHATGSASGERFEVTSTVRNVTMDPGLDDERFTFDPPANATREQDAEHRTTYGSVSELRSETRLSVPDPDLPADIRFRSGTVLTREGEDHSLRLRYTNETSELTVIVIDAAQGVPDGEPVTVGDASGVYREYGISGVVTWQCDGTTYSVSGDLVGRERLFAVAESIGCG